MSEPRALCVPITIRSKEAKALLESWKRHATGVSYIIVGQLHVPDEMDQRWIMRVGLVIGSKKSRLAMQYITKACGLQGPDDVLRVEET